MRSRDIVVWGVVVAGLLFVVPSLRDGCGAPAVRAGDRAPRFSLVLVGSGETWDSESLNGQPYALLFFATWCGSCRSEMPAVARVFHEEPSLRLYAVSDEPGDRVAQYLASSGLALPAAGDAGGMFASFGVRAVPTMVVVNEQGVVEFARAGSGAVREGLRRLRDLETTGLTPTGIGDPASGVRQELRGGYGHSRVHRLGHGHGPRARAGARPVGAGQAGHAAGPGEDVRARRDPNPRGDDGGAAALTRNPEDEGWQASGGLMGCLRDQEGGKHVNRMSCHDTPSMVDNAETA